MIKDNIKDILSKLPQGVELVAAAKKRTAVEILEAIDAGIKIVGENYVQEAQKVIEVIGSRAQWHFIGHMQKNKVRKAVKLFDMIETVDSYEIAYAIDTECKKISRVMPVLIEINSGKEKQKFGVLPEDAEAVVKQISSLSNISVNGLMTMGPFMGEPEDFRPYFIRTRQLFEKLKEKELPDVEMKYLSMGMTSSYKTAIEEGANMVRIGTLIFGERRYS